MDGDYHFTKEGIEKDRKRDENLKSLGIQVLRFENEEVFNALPAVLEKIESLLTTPDPSLKGGSKTAKSRNFGRQE